MNPDPWQRAWQSQTPPSGQMIDAELLLQEVQRSQQAFAATIFWRDVREVAIALLLVPVWILLGTTLSLPWTWYLVLPVLVWNVGFMLVVRRRGQRQAPETGEPLRQSVERSLAQVKQQIWLLKNVLWWCLLPTGIAMLAFLGQVAWQAEPPIWLTALVTAGLVAAIGFVLGFVYRSNQLAVRKHLEPRRQELEALLQSLADETDSKRGDASSDSG